MPNAPDSIMAETLAHNTLSTNRNIYETVVSRLMLLLPDDGNLTFATSPTASAMKIFTQPIPYYVGEKQILTLKSVRDSGT
jgi:hypothetical protein